MTFSNLIQGNHEIHAWRHATAILQSDFQQELADIQTVLEAFRLRKTGIRELRA